MRKTYAYNSIIFGFLVGILFASKGQTALGVVLGIIITVVGFIVIRGIENALYKGANAAGQAVSNAVKKKKEESKIQNNICPKCGAVADNETVFCQNCGEKIQ